jgi:hypothetical protein
MSQLPNQVLNQVGGTFNQGINAMNQPQYNQIPQQMQEGPAQESN